MLTPEIREYAETPDRFASLPEGSTVTRHDDGRICVIQGATWASVTAPSVRADELDNLIAQVHDLVPADKQQAWWIGPSARPTGLVGLLRERGFDEPRDRVGELRAVGLTEGLVGPSEDVEVRMIQTLEDFVTAREVQWDAFETPEERRAINRGRLREDFEESMTVGVPVAFLALLEGKPGATAMAIPSERGVFLIGGCTAPWARGRGLYRALVRARWDYAVSRGTPAVITHANPATSYPILDRLGFEDVCTITRLEEKR